ncbi:unnamed protein product [Haemonchus placei]|uniref:Uncharacterized protein n=1 Tax=Haemonchus placei TaxID=6290 RepID=A0A3P7WLB5_HAEPC|nr:unnamed protein product [Haemonchus placei]
MDFFLLQRLLICLTDINRLDFNQRCLIARPAAIFFFFLIISFRRSS